MSEQLNSLLKQTDPVILDLKISLLVSALRSTRSRQTIENVPPTFASQSCLKINKLNPVTINVALLSQVIENLPLGCCSPFEKSIPKYNTSKKMNGKGKVELEEKAKALIDWLLHSTSITYQPTTTTSVLNRHCFENSDWKYHFAVNKKPGPNDMTDFTLAKQKYGSIKAYHGSPVWNWHAILEHNLKNLSDTKLMSSGNIFGNGIYLSTSLSLACNYSSGLTCSVLAYVCFFFLLISLFFDFRHWHSFEWVEVEIALHPKYVKQEQSCNGETGKSLPKSYFVVTDNRFVRPIGLLVGAKTQKEEQINHYYSMWMIAVYIMILVSVIFTQISWKKLLNKLRWIFK
ncbi:hypothetical protein RFI_01385 [Reticulomyxa filosa]|uniref:Poly [ADP-ribose] polymerase n=1 Tax=Reticulomyxa filosa TaxID=46433 RepID=X6PAV8_RETFI|nr:hypothetical protein RFI_01385 [Reticulomyxa filosa]|eukprot:ETO35680.1 hypothetical protein RFI_01385 [Reticulomyxa filosa]